MCHEELTCINYSKFSPSSQQLQVVYLETGMHEDPAEMVLRLYKKGAEVLFAESHVGDVKVKVLHGPFKLMVKRYRFDHDAAANLRAALSDARKKRA
jgi:hypothetical protein